jgi:hypothetical protein
VNGDPQPVTDRNLNRIPHNHLGIFPTHDGVASR